MTTIDNRGNHHHGAGAPGAGQFAGKGHSEPTGTLTAESDNPTLPTDEQFAEFGRRIAAMLGSRSEWNSGDILQEASDHCEAALGMPLGGDDPAARAMWRGVADDVGVSYDVADSEYQECKRCYDEVLTLSTDGLCDGCVEEQETTTECRNCGERVPNGDMCYVGTPDEMCDSCDHNARRSGWIPPRD